MRNAEAEARNSAEKVGHGDGERQREPGHKPGGISCLKATPEADRNDNECRR